MAKYNYKATLLGYDKRVMTDEEITYDQFVTVKHNVISGNIAASDINYINGVDFEFNFNGFHYEFTSAIN